MDSNYDRFNIFEHYSQKENHFTHSLITILALSQHDDPEFGKCFFKKLINIDVPKEKYDFKMLRYENETVKKEASTEDARISAPSFCFYIEAKVVSAALLKEQIERHLTNLGQEHPKLKKLILLTPDDSTSGYINDKFVSLSPHTIIHLEWRKVYKYFTEYVSKSKDSTFCELIRDFIEITRKDIFDQDIAGIIAKIKFGPESGVCQDTYLDEVPTWADWGTPRRYHWLDGTGRKLLLYDNQVKAITMEVEISKIEEGPVGDPYRFRNIFVPNSARKFNPPISLGEIRKLPKFEIYGVSKKDRQPYRILTRDQYRQLLSSQKDK
jgi:hypothetical protein